MDGRLTSKQRALVRDSQVDRNSDAVLAMAFELLSPKSEPWEPDQTGVQEADSNISLQPLQETHG
jgi:hypothetical protein